MPMLELFRREGVVDYVCVVTRYFGGVLLGTGGLLRAYTQSAKDALDAAGAAAVRRWTELEIPAPMPLLSAAAGAAAFGGVVQGVDYGGRTCARALCRASRRRPCARVFDLSGGASAPWAARSCRDAAGRSF